MRNNRRSKMMLCLFVATMLVMVSSVNPVFAQAGRSIVPYPRDILVEPIDPVTRMPQTSFCIGANTIDVKLTNNTGYRKYVSVVNRDTSGMERTLYNGWLESGTQYLSKLMRTQLELTGPAGTEMVRVDVNGGQMVPGNWVTFYVRDCGGGTYPPGPGGYAQLWARIYPYAIEQGKKGTITLQTNVESQPNAAYYFEILNSWDQLWKRLPVSKRPYEQYQVTLAVGKTTKPGMLTYTVNLWQELSFSGKKKVATTYFSFRIVTPGSTPAPYDPNYPCSPGMPYGPEYPEMPGTPYMPGYPETPGCDPYSGSPSSGMPYNPAQPYTMPQYGGYPSGMSNNPYGYYLAPQSMVPMGERQMAPQGERQMAPEGDLSQVE